MTKLKNTIRIKLLNFKNICKDSMPLEFYLFFWFGGLIYLFTKFVYFWWIAWFYFSVIIMNTYTKNWSRRIRAYANERYPNKK